MARRRYRTCGHANLTFRQSVYVLFTALSVGVLIFNAASTHSRKILRNAFMLDDTSSSSDDNSTAAVTASTSAAPLSDDLTVVTAYFDIGSFQKGAGGGYFTPSLYHNWITVFSKLESPTVIYVDTNDSFVRFAEMRSKLPAKMTHLQLVDRKQMWAFGLQPDIAKIFAKPGYPYHPPNTVVAAYSSAMHAKYELMQTAIRDNPFRTRYFCWLDVGLFRDLTADVDRLEPFRLDLPPDFRPDSVAYTEVYNRIEQLSPVDIINGNHVWLCGCFFVGVDVVLVEWAKEYQAATEKLISAGLMSTDQQVIYAMFNTMKPRTKIQTYRADGRFNEWFHLGFVAREAGLRRPNGTATAAT